MPYSNRLRSCFFSFFSLSLASQDEIAPLKPALTIETPSSEHQQQQTTSDLPDLEEPQEACADMPSPEHALDQTDSDLPDLEEPQEACADTPSPEHALDQTDSDLPELEEPQEACADTPSPEHALDQTDSALPELEEPQEAYPDTPSSEHQQQQSTSDLPELEEPQDNSEMAPPLTEEQKPLPPIEDKPQACLPLRAPSCCPSKLCCPPRCWSIFARAGLFCPLSHRFVQFFPRVWPEYSLLASYHFFNRWTVTGNGTITYAKGKAKGLHNHLNFLLWSVAALLQYDIVSTPCFKWYLGVGPKYFFVSSKTSGNEIKTIDPNGLGGVF